MNFRVVTTIVILACMMANPLHAQETSRPAHHPTRQIERDQRESEARKADLEKRAGDAAAEMERTRGELVSLAADIRENEKRLGELDRRIAEGQAEQDEIEARLKTDRRSIGDLVLALERLDRTPPEAVLARPGAPLQTAQSAMLLQSILPGIYGRAEKLKKDIARLNELIAKMETDRAEMRATSEQLAARQKDVTGLLQKRKTLYADAQTGIRQEEASLRAISARASNLRDLVTKLDEREKQAEKDRLLAEKKAREASAAAKTEAERESPTRQPARPATFRPTPIPKAGSAQLPIAGLIRIGYRQQDDIGAESQGLTIEGRPGGLVVAPMGGVVRYTGNFKSYGKIIIVEHQKDYHSLIAGLAKIDTVVGQSVTAGEPVGTLAKSSPDGGKPTLYYELRLNGEPVDPARRFSGL